MLSEKMVDVSLDSADFCLRLREEGLLISEGEWRRIEHSFEDANRRDGIKFDGESGRDRY